MHLFSSDNAVRLCRAQCVPPRPPTTRSQITRPTAVHREEGTRCQLALNGPSLGQGMCAGQHLKTAVNTAPRHQQRGTQAHTCQPTQRARREEETRYLVRTLVQNLRVGASWRSLVPALGKACVLASSTRPTKAALEAAAAAAGAAFHLCPSLNVLVRPHTIAQVSEMGMIVCVDSNVMMMVGRERS